MINFKLVYTFLIGKKIACVVQLECDSPSIAFTNFCGTSRTFEIFEVALDKVYLTSFLLLPK